MEVPNLKILFRSILPFKQLGFGVDKCFEKISKRNETFNVGDLKKEIDHIQNNKQYNLVALALETGLITYKEKPKLDVDNLLIRVGNLYRGSYLGSTFNISEPERNLFSEVIRSINLEDFEDIHALVDYEYFDFLRFDTKVILKECFGEDVYDNEDVFLFLKKLVWDFLYPGLYSEELIKATSLECEYLINENTQNEGWFPLSSLKTQLGIDNFLVSKLKFKSSIQHLYHYNNDLKLGFVKQIS
ncbi:hypothetical protein [Ochrovirga pacifica]|uniref:hypothetical protein n=1 Tax=Ochrovirga pacifica TaxID=1042376 RepID=UPI0002558E59|nr:hypothetical protein [Ochrovirga pacifica]